MISAAGKKRIAAAQRARWARTRGVNGKLAPSSALLGDLKKKVGSLIEKRESEVKNLRGIQAVLDGLGGFVDEL